jgi:hypothetical protein
VALTLSLVFFGGVELGLDYIFPHTLDLLERVFPRDHEEVQNVLKTSWFVFVICKAIARVHVGNLQPTN